VLLIALAGTIIGYFVATSETDTDRKFFQSTAGAVLFDHGEHGEAAGSCVVCHHNLYSAELAVSCQDCHDEDVKARDVEHSSLKQIHSYDCSMCHEQQQDDKLAVSCRDCHSSTEASQTLADSCIDCHDDGYTADMLEHNEYQEIEEHTCQSCHNTRSVADAYHANCSQCHLENSSERFSEANGDVKCAACHLR